MDKHYFIEILNKHLKGESSKEEDDFLIAYYNLFERDADVNVLLQGDKNKIKTSIKENIWQRINTEEQQHQRTIYLSGWIAKVAAAVITISICSAVIFLATKRTITKPDFVNIVNQQKESRLIHLEDGSTIILHTGSKLTYLSSFKNVDKREVFLEGEAYFDISHNPSQPFIVHTGKLETTVLGTAFNIKAIAGDSNITVAVTRGKVKISDTEATLGLLTKGQKIIYNKRKFSLNKSINEKVDLDWEKQDILLDDVTVEDAAKLLEDRFNVKISFNDATIKSNRFTTVFLKDEKIEQVLQSICEFNDASYQYNKQNASIIISKISTQTN